MVLIFPFRLVLGILTRTSKHQLDSYEKSIAQDVQDIAQPTSPHRGHSEMEMLRSNHLLCPDTTYDANQSFVKVVSDGQ
jgi:hypothetical protein